MFSLEGWRPSAGGYARSGEGRTPGLRRWRRALRTGSPGRWRGDIAPLRHRPVPPSFSAVAQEERRRAVAGPRPRCFGPKGSAAAHTRDSGHCPCARCGRRGGDIEGIRVDPARRSWLNGGWCSRMWLASLLQWSSSPSLRLSQQRRGRHRGQPALRASVFHRCLEQLNHRPVVQLFEVDVELPNAEEPLWLGQRERAQ